MAQRAGVKGVCDLPLLQLLGEDLPGAVVVRAESEGPPEEDRFDEESPVKVADESRPLRFAVWEAYQSSPASAHITVQGCVTTLTATANLRRGSVATRASAPISSASARATESALSNTSYFMETFSQRR